MAEAKDVKDRFRGSILGLALGDAFGTTVEFKPRGSFKEVVELQGGGPFQLEAGQWTDDTSMMLCMLRSLLEKKEYDPLDMMDRFIKWWREGWYSMNGRCFDIGITTRRALEAYQTRTDRVAHCGPTDTNQSGNGSLMRLCPIPLFFYKDIEKALDTSADSSKMTHGSPHCVDACRYFAGLLIGALQGKTKDELLAPNYSPLGADYWKDHPMCKEIADVAAGSFRTDSVENIKGSGWVVKTLESVLWAFYNTDNFMDGLRKVVNLGDDADTTGAIYGQIAGAYYGYYSIPTKYKDRVHWHDRILAWADALCELTENPNANINKALKYKVRLETNRCPMM